MASKLISFIYLNISSIATKDDFRQTTLAELRDIPIPIIDSEKQQAFICLVDYILFLYTLKDEDKINEYVPNSHLIQQFEEVLDAMVYELYLPAEIKVGGAEVLKHLNNLPELKEGLDEQNLKTIEKVYKELSDPKHPISAALLKLLTIEEVNIIEGRK